MQVYNFYELDGYLLLNRLQRTDYAPLDFSTEIRKNLTGVIDKVNSHNDNALFYQMKQCIQEQAEEGSDYFRDLLSNWGRNSLKNTLLYINLARVFPIRKYAENNEKNKQHKQEVTLSDAQAAEYEKIVEHFFMDGFSIVHPEGAGVIHYVPFEKSASMARQSSMLFIDSRFLERMEQRLRLRFDFTTDRVLVSKLYAYTGLYLTDAKRIEETPEFVLNEDTVIVIDDNMTKDKDGIKVPMEVITADKEEIDENGFRKWKIKKYGPEELSTKINSFDGEGLISPNYCKLINDALHSTYGMTGTAASIQIRMPFTKGVLHHVDFHKFVCEKLGTDSCKDVYIKDYFGVIRSLEKVQIILTASMFKGGKWLKNSKISGVAKDEDHMKVFFSRFHEYDHAFYVGNTDMNISRSARTKLNYQFLNTLALTDEEFEAIIADHVKRASSESASALLREMDPFETIENEDLSFDDSIPERETWCEVALRNPAFNKDIKVKGKLKGIRYSLLKDLGRGRLTVDGSIKFLSGDLLRFLSHMISRLEPGENVTEELKKRVTKEINKDKSLRATRFFTAECVPGNPVFSGGGKKLRFQSKEFYGILRSPHLSRNEQCSLRPYIPKEEDDYKRYFGHLKGILMVPEMSFAPQALGGADFDGDLVKIITDKRVNRAIDESCYYPGETHVRRLPIIMIPDTTANPVMLPKNGVHFNTLKDTFSSRVGEISNRAIYLGQREYDEKKPDPEYQFACESCTILVGLEIDAAKTGEHPYLDDVLGDNEKDYFIDRKEEIDWLPDEFYNLEVIEKKKSGSSKGKVSYHRLAAVHRKTDKEYVSGAYPNEYDELHRLDSLPYRFLKEFSAIINAPAPKVENNLYRFAFEKDENWKNHASDTKKLNTLKALIKAYCKIHRTASEVSRIKKRVTLFNYVGRVNTILKIQYKGLENDFSFADMQEKIFFGLLDRLDSYQKAEKVLNKLSKDHKWQFLATDEEKYRYFEEVLFKDLGDELSDEEKNVLYNFRWNGYFLLYYCLKDIILHYYETVPELEISQGEDVSNLSVESRKYYEEFREIYEDALSERESQKVWNSKIVKRCRDILLSVFDDNVAEAIMYTHKLRSCDSSGRFFWDVFTANEILYKSGGQSHAE